MFKSLIPTPNAVPTLRGRAPRDKVIGNTQQAILSAIRASGSPPVSAASSKTREEQDADATFDALIDMAPDAIVVAAQDGTIASLNARAESMFGYTRSQLVGQTLALLIPERARRSVDGRRAAPGLFSMDSGLRALGAGGELFGRRKDGTEIPIDVSLSPHRTAGRTLVSAVIRDVSERVRAEAATKLLARRLASALESLKDAFALFDEHDRLVVCNGAYRRLVGDSLALPLVGRSYEELLDAWIEEIVVPGPSERALFRTMQLSGRPHERPATSDIRLRDGRSLRLVERPTLEGGTVTIIWDVTDDALLCEELREARLVAEAASRAKTDFLSSMSHELRTPLNAILGFAQLLQRDQKQQLSERHQGRVEQILRGGEHLLRLIDDILDLSRIEAGALSVSIEPVGVPDVLDEVVATLESMAAREGVRVEIAPLPADLPNVAVDRTRFAQILMNFASNAIKYNRPTGSVVFVVSTTNPARLRITVCDDGIGIPADKQQKLFHPFERAGQELSAIPGTGIGLVITKRLAQLMNGDVGFRSVPGEGSEFWVDVPVHGLQARPALPEPHRALAAAAAEEGLILYVEDNLASISLMKDLVSTLDDVALLAVTSAELGIDLARKRQPKIIIMDINLPGSSGLDAMRTLRESPETRNIPVIALTAAATERDRKAGRRAGFHRYLTKPVNVDEMLAALEELLVPRR